MEDQAIRPDNAPDSASSQSMLSPQTAADLRKLSHDLSNALEIVVQTSYLLSTVDLKEPATEWLHMLEEGVARALDLNNAIRTYLKDHMAP